MKYIFVLARNGRDAAKFINAQPREERRQYRAVTRAAHIKGSRPEKIIELEGWQKRPDRHAVEAAIKFMKAPREKASLDSPEVAAGRKKAAATKVKVDTAAEAANFFDVT